MEDVLCLHILDRTIDENSADVKAYDRTLSRFLEMAHHSVRNVDDRDSLLPVCCEVALSELIHSSIRTLYVEEDVVAR